MAAAPLLPPPPLQVVITNMAADHVEHVEAKAFPGRPDSASYKVPFSQVVYIEATDFKPKVRRCAPYPTWVPSNPMGVPT